MLKVLCSRGRRGSFTRTTPQNSVFPARIDMGRIPVPTEILDTRGAFLKHPERRRPNEPQETRPLGNAPKYLTAEEKKLWREFGKMVPYGVAKSSDRCLRS